MTNPLKPSMPKGKMIPGVVILWVSMFIGMLLAGYILLTWFFRSVRNAIANLPHIGKIIDPGVLALIVILLVVIGLGWYFRKHVNKYGTKAVEYGKKVFRKISWKRDWQKIVLAIIVVLLVYKFFLEGMITKVKTGNDPVTLTNVTSQTTQQSYSATPVVPPGKNLVWGINELTKGTKYYFYRSVSFTTYLFSPYHEGIEMKYFKEKFETQVYWVDSFREDGSSYHDQTQYFNDNSWGTFYFTVDEDMTIEIRPS